MPEAANDERTDRPQRGIRQLFGVMDMFCVLIVVVVVQLCLSEFIEWY